VMFRINKGRHKVWSAFLDTKSLFNEKSLNFYSDSPVTKEGSRFQKNQAFGTASRDLCFFPNGVCHCLSFLSNCVIGGGLRRNQDVQTPFLKI
jgi:hypothetical protein